MAPHVIILRSIMSTSIPLPSRLGDFLFPPSVSHQLRTRRLYRYTVFSSLSRYPISSERADCIVIRSSAPFHGIPSAQELCNVLIKFRINPHTTLDSACCFCISPILTLTVSPSIRRSISNNDNMLAQRTAYVACRACLIAVRECLRERLAAVRLVRTG